MSMNRDSAESLIEILSLCEQTLAAFDAHNGTHDVAPIPAKARMPECHRPNKTARPFVLIRGGLGRQEPSPTIR